ncbi:MAG: dihydrokaempferol 4-reductase [Rhodobacterales bacterium 17-64-5]|nr:MAG: dihydrokaempferol 4-reductase [Rhodobacterales bacterium 17-64-5]
MPETVLLTGVSGFIAKHVALKLLNAGYDVRGTVRRLDRADEVRSAVAPHLTAGAGTLSFVQADLESDAGWDDAVRGVSAVVHTASPFPIAQPKDENVLIRPAVEGTERVLNAAAAAGVTRIVLTSSTVAVFDEGRHQDLQDEANWCDLDLPSTSAYAKSKTLAERKAWEIAKAKGLQLTTINPGVVLGPPLDEHYGSSMELVERIMKGKDPAMPDLGFAAVDVRDVAEMHLRALQKPETAGKRYLATAGSLTMPEMGRILKDAYPTRRIPTMIAPLILLRVMALFDAQLRAIVPNIGKHPKVSNARAVKDMGMMFTAPKAALLASADWLEKHGKVWK